MTDTPQQQATQLKLRLRTRHVPAAALGQIVQALLRCEEQVLVLRDTEGGWSLGAARVVAVDHETVTVEFTRLRPLSVTEADIARQHGAGMFEPPKPPQEIPSDE
jgi:hypothetical protein